ncbi:MAG: hypothetical protein JO273_00650 [Methylobacteriaceae bacterium]|nr:hypothetical protein [Methylobacteriaceae bacterium]
MNVMLKSIAAWFRTFRGRLRGGKPTKKAPTNNRKPGMPVRMRASAKEFSTPVESASSMRSGVIDMGSGRNVKAGMLANSYRHLTDSFP